RADGRAGGYPALSLRALQRRRAPPPAPAALALAGASGALLHPSGDRRGARQRYLSGELLCHRLLRVAVQPAASIVAGDLLPAGRRGGEPRPPVRGRSREPMVPLGARARQLQAAPANALRVRLASPTSRPLRCQRRGTG